MAATRLAGRCWHGALLALLAGVAVLGDGKTVAEDDANPALDQVLARTIDAYFWRDYPEDVFAALEIRTGLKCISPATIERTFLFSHQQKNRPVHELLEKLTAVGHLEMERRDGLLLFWRRADDDVVKELGEKLKNVDRWARCEAAWELGNLADPRIYPLLFQAAGDKDPGVAQWALFSLSKHLAVLPYLGPAGKEIVVKAAQEGMSRTRTGFLPGLPYHQLLGALNTPESVDILLVDTESDNAQVCSSAVDGLGYSRQSRASNALVRLTEDAVAVKPKRRKALPLRLSEALARNGDARCIEALIALSANPHLLSRTRGLCLDALSRSRNGKAADAVIEAIGRVAVADWDTFFYPDARDPRIADALATHVEDIDEEFREMAISALAMARDPRAIDPLVDAIEADPQYSYGKPELLAAIRDPRAGLVLQKLIGKDVGGDPWGLQGWGDALMATRDPRVIEVAFALLKDEQKAMEVRCRAAMALAGTLTDRRPIAELISYLRAVGKPVVLAIAQQGSPPHDLAVAIFSREPAWVDVLVELADDPNRTIGDAAFRLLALSQNPCAQKALLRAFQHADALVRLGAVRAAAVRNAVNQSDTVFVEALAARLADDHPAVRRAAAMALGQFGDRRAVAPLIEAARAERDVPDAVKIWTLLSQFDDPGAADVLIELLRDPNNPQREEALYALNASANPKVAGALLEMACDVKWPVGLRAAAAMQVYRSGSEDQQVLDALCAVMNDPTLERGIRSYVVDALRYAESPKVADGLLTCIRNADIPQDAREDVVSLLTPVKFGTDAKEEFARLLAEENVPASLRARVAAMLVGGRSRRGRTVIKPGETDPRVLKGLLTLHASNELSSGARRALMEALVYTGDAAALQIVYDSFPGADLKTKLDLAVALCVTSRDEHAIEPLLDVLNYGEQKDRRKASFPLIAYVKTENINVDVKQKIRLALDEYRKTKNLSVSPPPPPPHEEF